jgi:hypothetical protein
MARPGQSSDQESRYFVLLNMLKEAGHQMDGLEVGSKARETLRALIDLCQTDFNNRFR